MKWVIPVVIFYFVLLNVSSANIYNCSSPSERPHKSNQGIKSELLISNMPPYITSNELNVANLDPKTPFLIYYAIDSSEAFMQYTVRYEIAKLQESCKKNSNVQFVAFLNSLYTEKNSFILCKNQLLKEVNFKNYPDLNKILKSKIKYISNLGHLKDNNIIKYTIPSKQAAFRKYPLAHPDFLHELIYFATTHKSLFPNQIYSAFINLKSHGSKNHVLSGMHPCQEKAKELSSNKIIRTILSKTEIQFLKSNGSYDAVEKNLKEYDRIITKIDLGQYHGIGSFSDDPNLGEDRLGEDRLSTKIQGIGEAVAGLGVDEGLGSEFSFGTDHQSLSLILDSLYKQGSNRSLGFLMLESCDSNRNPSVFHTNLSNIFGYYTSKKSLWYRNLNWWEILAIADGSTVKVANILQEQTPKIPNIEVVPVQK